MPTTHGIGVANPLPVARVGSGAWTGIAGAILPEGERPIEDGSARRLEAGDCGSPAEPRSPWVGAAIGGLLVLAIGFTTLLPDYESDSNR